MNALLLKSLSYMIFDLETTGLYAEDGDEMIEIGAVVVENLEITDKTFHSMVNPKRLIPAASSAVNGIRDKDVADAPTADKILPDFLSFSGNRIWVAQNARFDMSFISKKTRQLGIPMKQNVIVDTIGLSKMLFPYETSHNLDVIIARLGIAKSGDRHRSMDDCKYTALALIEFLKMLESQGITALPEIEQAFVKGDASSRTSKQKSRSLFN